VVTLKWKHNGLSPPNLFRYHLPYRAVRHNSQALGPRCARSLPTKPVGSRSRGKGDFFPDQQYRPHGEKTLFRPRSSVVQSLVPVFRRGVCCHSWRT